MLLAFFTTNLTSSVLKSDQMKLKPTFFLPILTICGLLLCVDSGLVIHGGKS